MLIFGDLLGGIGKVIGDVPGVGDALQGLGDVPVLGDVLEHGAPFAGLIPGVGPIASAALGALGSGAGGGNIGEGALKGFGIQQIMDSFRQAGADRERARELTNQSIGSFEESRDFARQQSQRDQPLRFAFRRGAMNFIDPTNPLANPVNTQGLGAGNFPGSFGPGQPAQQGPPRGSSQSRISSVVRRGFDPGGSGTSTPTRGREMNFSQRRPESLEGRLAQAGQKVRNGPSRPVAFR